MLSVVKKKERTIIQSPVEALFFLCSGVSHRQYYKTNFKMFTKIPSKQFTHDKNKKSF